MKECSLSLLEKSSINKCYYTRVTGIVNIKCIQLYNFYFFLAGDRGRFFVSPEGKVHGGSQNTSAHCRAQKKAAQELIRSCAVKYEFVEEGQGEG